MIKILRENNLTDKEIENKYNEQYSRITLQVDNAIDDYLEKITKLRNTLISEVIDNYIPKYYLDSNKQLNVVSDNEDIEEREEQIKCITKLEEIDDESLKSLIDYELKSLISED